MQIYILGGRLADGMATDIHAWRRMYTLLDVFKRRKVSVGDIILVRDECEVDEGAFGNLGRRDVASCPFAP